MTSSLGKAPHSPAVAILMYHEVVAEQELAGLAGKLQKSYVMSDVEFERHLKLIRGLGCTIVGMNELVQALDGRTVLPARSVVISFDDGYAGNYRYAYPLLRRYGASATFFVVSRKIGDPCMMTWLQLRELAADGMLIESHTASHPLLSTLDRDATYEELRESKQSIEQNAAVSVRYISLPNGDSNAWYADAARELGYEAGCGSAVGLNTRKTDRYTLKRIPVKRGMSESQLRGYICGSRTTLGPARARAFAKDALVGVLSKAVYDKIYNRLFGVEDQTKSSL